MQKAIETTILPSYIVKQRNQRLIQLLLAVIFVLVIFVNYNVLIDFLSTEVGNRSEYRLGVLLWWGLLLVCLIWLLSKFFKRRIGPWFAGKSTLAVVALAACWIAASPLLLLFLVLSQEWRAPYNEWQLWGGLSLVAIIALTPISFSMVATWYTLASFFSGHTLKPSESAYRTHKDGEMK